MLGYFQTHLFYAQADTNTLKFTQELFDKETIRLRGVSVTSGRGDSRTAGQGEGSYGTNGKPERQAGQGREYSESETDSFQEQLHDAVTIRQLTTLKTGGAKNNYLVGAFVFSTGRVWKRKGMAYLYTEFAQR